MKTAIVRLAAVGMGIVLCAGSVITPALAATPTAISVQPTPPPSQSPDLIVTTIAGSNPPDFIELYNQSSAPLSLAGWNIQFTIHDNGDAAGCADISSNITLPGGWLLSKKYLTLERTSTLAPGSLTVPFAVGSAALLTGCVAPVLSTIALVAGSNGPEQTVTIPPAVWSPTNTTIAQHRQRGNSPNSTRTISGSFTDDYKVVTGGITLNSDPLYTPPADAAGLQMLEILPNARSCSPLDNDPTCSDYIKLYNPTNQPIDLARYRLRAGAKGQGQSITNTFTWNRTVDPADDELMLPAGQYFMLMVRNDGQALNLTDSGNYVWLEDAYGTSIYEPVVQYPEASAAARVGAAWAYDGSSWRWTTVPRPGAANYFPPEVIPAPPVPPVSIAVSGLAPCSPGEYRNPDTNRCKSIISTAVTTLTPCAEGQERNPETNRCRSAVTATASESAPCQPGWERNPDTNRCRKIPAVQGDSVAKVEDIQAPITDTSSLIIAGIALLAAVAYAVYEWRQEMALALGNLKSSTLASITRPFGRHNK